MPGIGNNRIEARAIVFVVFIVATLWMALKLAGIDIHLWR
jgi:hypothetical protein